MQPRQGGMQGVSSTSEGGGFASACVGGVDANVCMVVRRLAGRTTTPRFIRPAADDTSFAHRPLSGCNRLRFFTSCRVSEIVIISRSC